MLLFVCKFEGLRGMVSQTAVGSFLVVDGSPLFEFFAGIVQVVEVVLVEAFVAQFAVEAFDVAVLGGLAGFDEG